MRTNIECQITESRSDSGVRIENMNSRVWTNRLSKESPDCLIVGREAVTDHDPRSSSAKVFFRSHPSWLKIVGDSFFNDRCDDGRVASN